MGRLYDNCQERNRCLVPEGNTTDIEQENEVEQTLRTLNHTLDLVAHLVKKLRNSTTSLIG